MSHRGSRRTLTGFLKGREWYVGPALWFPDGKAVVMTHVQGERERPFAVDLSTGMGRTLPPGVQVPSLGGRS
jgi:hypothetical protein